MTTLTTAGRQVHAGTHEGGRVIVGVDDSPAGLAALRWAVRFARSRRAQLLAVGTEDALVVGSTRGHRLGRAVHGSVSAYCARHSRCPVTVVAASRPPHIRGEAA
jgi:nucleotide-binding universal stress UspA family protein